MSDFVKIITSALPVINRIQDNVQQALPDKSALTEGQLVENETISPGSTVNHGLGRQAVGALVVKQTDAANPVLVTGLSTTTITVSGAFVAGTTASFWVF